ncbi:DUF2459 domain-containing protein [Erythrobacter litoralis]|uniref:DUF2459 domain-containing protein n=1 Tax=Erythrobacter litoralis (strain HTCC2594) TaxID=314225 RepID=Q2N9W2_ERYLH|nr:DUF2459 domain-containing protein [Erythrobacter litoralis]ABC63529.1 hypothetical protein ELI_07185 [Erythrobacter litoralis HTCC2594]
MDAKAYRTQRGLKPWFGGTLRILGIAVGALLLLVLAFLLSAWIGSSIPRNAGWTEPEAGIPVMIETNGLHTGIVMPVVSPLKDWRETFPTAGRPREDGWMPTHIAVGWGEKEVFLNTPTWTDLDPAVAANVVFGGGEGLLRVAHYVRPQASEDFRWITLRPEEYTRLVEQVEAALPPVPLATPRKSYTSYQQHAVHFDATGRYTLTNTCNQWVSDTLAEAGIKIGTWTPLAGGVMKWIPEGE